MMESFNQGSIQLNRLWGCWRETCVQDDFSLNSEEIIQIYAPGTKCRYYPPCRANYLSVPYSMCLQYWWEDKFSALNLECKKVCVFQASVRVLGSVSELLPEACLPLVVAGQRLELWSSLGTNKALDRVGNTTFHCQDVLRKSHTAALNNDTFNSTTQLSKN